MCQTHYRQHLELGEVREIKRFRPRRKDVVRLGGFSLVPEAADVVSRVAVSRGVTPNHQITDILEEWAQETNRAAKRRGRAPKHKK
jgi:hypothetical protein